MGWVLATLLTLGGVGWLVFLRDDETEADPSAPVQSIGGVNTQSTGPGVNSGMTLEYLQSGWNEAEVGVNTHIGHIIPTSKSAFNWRGWGGVITQVNEDDYGVKYYDLRIDYGYNAPSDSTGGRATHYGPINGRPNCSVSAMPETCRMMNELFDDLEDAIAAGVIVPNGA